MEGFNRRSSFNRNGGGNRSFGGPRGRSSGGFRKNFNRGPREMHKAVCAECKVDCEVPFKPTEGKPVLCRDCFMKKRDSGFTPRNKTETQDETDSEDF